VSTTFPGGAGWARSSDRPRTTGAAQDGREPIVITGGCGFIGCNLADLFLREGRDVVVLDNLSRAGVQENLVWLQRRHGSRVHPVIADVRDADAITPVLAEAAAIFHLAAQTAVTTSLGAPVEDFEINLLGTLNVLEAVRRGGRGIPVIFSSTNKVYGALPWLELAESAEGYAPRDPSTRRFGLDETIGLDFCTPYGCSKGAADQYVLDYGKTYGIPVAVLRMSCIYGPRQFGTEDQGWVAHFLIRALAGEPITVYGDGKQVRDVLNVQDAVQAYRSVLEHMDEARGRAFNLGGGPRNAVSIERALQEIEALAGRPPNVTRAGWRTGDQLYFVADTRRLQDRIGWSPGIGWRDGFAELAQWLRQERGLGPVAKARVSA
jgi:CDP-paratose 2-epimerase